MVSRWEQGSILVFTVALVACTSNRKPAPSEGNIGFVSEPLLTNGQRCISNNQCASGNCIDTVCCNTACGNGARDNLACSNVYGNVMPNNEVGTCHTLTDGQPCGNLESLNPCRWRGSNINGGNKCPAPGNGDPDNACYTCTTSADCKDGMPVCINEGCTGCSGDYPGGTTSCPTAALPACVNAACVQCSTTNSTACTGTTGSCNLATNTCVGCNGDFGSGATFACGADRPACLTTGPMAGACAECKGDVKPSPDPGPGGNWTRCTGGATFCNTAVALPVCVNCTSGTQCTNPTASVCAGNVCNPCNGNFGDPNASSACPTTTLPACVGGSCLECSATDATRCTAASGKPACCLGVSCTSGENNKCVECLSGADCTDPARPFCTPNNTCSSTCTTDAQCAATPATPRCDYPGPGVCVTCINDNDCAGRPGTPLCDPSTHACVQCTSNTQCSGTTPICAGGTCQGCNGDSGEPGATRACPSLSAPACQTPPAPNAGACVECNAGNATHCTGTTDVCDTNQNICVQCLTSAECTGSTPVCVAGACVACDGDNGPGPGTAKCPSTLLPACINGSCAECRVNNPVNVTACPPGSPVCSTATSGQFLNKCVQCTSNAQCVGANGICHLTNFTCTAGCSSDLNCSGTTPKCNTATSQCVQCLDSTQCGGTTPVCDTTTNTCVECSSDAQCSGTKPFCLGGTCGACNGDLGSGATRACKSPTAPACVTTGPDAGICVPCTNSNTTLCTGATPVCNTTNHTCVQCSTNGQCSGTTPVCNPAGTCVACAGDLGSGPLACSEIPTPACLTSGASSGACVECSATNATNCVGGKPVCDVAANVCVECTSNAQCTGPNGICDVTSHTCTTGCASDANCANPLPVCNTTTNLCVECDAGKTAFCVGSKPHCKVSNNTCVECLTGADCPSSKPVCTANNVCTATCNSSSQCPGSAPVCNPVTKTCVQCTGNSDCPATTPICNTTTNTCGSSCTKSSECPNDTPVCNPQTKKCVQCTGNTDCPPTSPICNTTTNTCGNECSKSSECPGEAPICNPQTKKCVQCSGNADCPPTAPICDPTTNTCGTNCTKSSECPGSAPVCNPQTKKCVQCATSSDCPATAPVCNPGTNTCGTTCAVDAECPGSTPVCNPQSKTCVQCIDSSSCPTTTPVCGANNTCVPDDFAIQGGGCACSSTQNGEANATPLLVGLGLFLTAFNRRRKDEKRN